MSEIYKRDGTMVYADHDYYENIAKTALDGKVLIALGDSYTVGMSSQYSSLAAKYGMVMDNRGVVSSTLSDHGTAVQTMYDRADVIVSDYTNGKVINGTTFHASDVGLITIMGGANDGMNIALEVGNSFTDTSPDTIYGSLHHILSIFQTTFPTAKILCITQPSNYIFVTTSAVTSDAQAQRIGFDSMADAHRLDDVQFSNYCMGVKEEIVRKMAWLYGLPLLDMFHEFPSISVPANRSTYWQSDKLHLTTAGYNLIRDALDDKIVELFGGG